LPLSTYTEAYWKIDLHNLLHFLELRMDALAQREIRDYAAAIGREIVRPLFPLVGGLPTTAWGDN
jgi:thymidylate synthase (FAD)